MMSDEQPDQVVPLVDEQATVHKRTVETGRVRVRTIVDEHQALVQEDLLRDEVRVERVPVDREIEVVPDIRYEGETIIIPVVEEVLVVEKRLVLKEELHIHRHAHLEHVEQPVTLRSTHAVVEREQRVGEMKPPKSQE